MLIKILIGIIIGYYVVRLLQAVHRFLYKLICSKLAKRRFIRISLIRQNDPGNEYWYLSLDAPLYDERHYFYFSAGWVGFNVAYVPIETIPGILKEMLVDRHLFQTRRDWAILREAPYVYSPIAIQEGQLISHALSDGADVFFIGTKGFDKKKLDGYVDQVSEWANLALPARVLSQREYFESEGELFKVIDQWSIVHRDKDFIDQFINRLAVEIGKKVIKKAGINGIMDSSLNAAAFFKFSSVTTTINVFAKDGYVVYQTLDQEAKVKITN
jgi:hypothetical protein